MHEECKRQNVPYTTVKYHIANGYSIDEAINKVKNKVFISDLAKEVGLKANTVRQRLLSGKTIEESLNPKNLNYQYYGGVRACDICDKYNLEYSKVKRRMKHYGWTFKDSLISFLTDLDQIKEIKETVPETKD